MTECRETSWGRTEERGREGRRRRDVKRDGDIHGCTDKKRKRERESEGRREINRQTSN